MVARKRGESGTAAVDAALIAVREPGDARQVQMDWENGCISEDKIQNRVREVLKVNARVKADVTVSAKANCVGLGQEAQQQQLAQIRMQRFQLLALVRWNI